MNRSLNFEIIQTSLIAIFITAQPEKQMLYFSISLNKIGIFSRKNSERNGRRMLYFSI